MILKIQRPLGGDMTLCLIYNEDKSVIGHPPYTEDVAALFPTFVDGEQEVRVYVHGSISKDGTLHVDSVIGHKKRF